MIVDTHVPVAQRIRASVYGTESREFESLQARSDQESNHPSHKPSLWFSGHIRNIMCL